MKDLYKSQIVEISKLTSDVEKCTDFMWVIRSMTQTISIIFLDIAISRLEEDEKVYNYIERIKKPTDGLPHEILDYLVPIFRSNFDDKISYGWFERDIYKQSLSKDYLKFVEFRNNDSSHGVLDKTKAKLWAENLEEMNNRMIKTFEGFFPSNEGRLKVLNNFRTTIPLVYNGLPFVINSIINRKGLWKIKGQTLSIVNSESFTLELSENCFFNLHSYESTRGYKLIEVDNIKKDIVFHNIPVRQTDIFEGRDEELKVLREWYGDEDSRVCLIYGDGGYGKTTFILESLNNLIEGNFNTENNLPLYICYYSAKMTRWTEDGLKHFKSSTPIIDDCVREVVKSQQELSKEWYQIGGKALVNKARSLLEKQEIGRNDILLVIDNTETMAQSSIEVKELSEVIKYISKNISRVILTSRRREVVQAEPISIEGLKESESVDLINNLAIQYNATTLQKAGENRLRKVAKKLMRKPLLIEAYVKYMKHSNSSIDDGLERFYKVSNEELLNFLYEDAWLRMNELQREVFLVAILLNNEIDNRVLNKICQLVEVNIEEFTQAYEETYFAEIRDYVTGFSFNIVPLAKMFFSKKLLEYLDEDQERFKDIANEVAIYIDKIDSMELAYKTDRVSEAFRSEFARFAKIHTDKGEILQAIEMYELALKDDPLNSYLYDRYAWLLINRTDYFSKALKLAQKAHELDKNNIDAIVNIALAFYKLGNLGKGDEYIDMSIKKGRSEAFSFLRKGIARYQTANKSTGEQEKKDLYTNAIKYLKKSQDSLRNEPVMSYEAKIRNDASRYINLSLRRYNNLRL